MYYHSGRTQFFPPFFFAITKKITMAKVPRESFLVQSLSETVSEYFTVLYTTTKELKNIFFQKIASILSNAYSFYSVLMIMNNTNKIMMLQTRSMEIVEFSCLRFYVKSKLTNVESLNLPFQHI